MPSASFVQSLDRGLILLETVAQARRPLNLDDLAAVLHIDRSSVFRLANTLKHRGWLAQLSDTKHYVLGSAIGRMASLSPWGDVLALLARSEVATLAGRTHETTHLAVREGRQAALIHHQLTEQPLGVSFGSGHCVPLHYTSVGRALLIDYDQERLVRLLGNEALPVFNKGAVCSIADLAAECRRSRQRGYALDDQEYHDGVRCIATPIHDPSGEVVASIGISAPVDRLPQRRIEEVGQQVMEVAKQITDRFGQVSSHQAPVSSRAVDRGSK